MTISGFDHVALPLRDADAMAAFYRALGLEVEENAYLVQVHFGDQMINFHRAEMWTRGDFTLRAPAATPPCGDLCFVWDGTETSLHARLDDAGAALEEGPVPRRGGRRVDATSVYTRDPDGNLLEIHDLPMTGPRVVVVGAGFGGIAAGVKMKKVGIHSFTIYESSLGIGGTWWDNTYPGAEVDVGSHLYSYSFKSHDWTRTHAQQAELQKYLEETVDEYRLRPHLRLGATVESAVWDDDRHVWTVRLDDGTIEECDVVVSGVGFLNVPRYPDWPGLDDFVGPKFHTSRWEHEHDLTGKVVAVVGTGSTATQIVPAIQPYVGHVYVFQREPGWVMPKGDRDFTPEERQTFSNPWRRRQERLRLKWLLEKNIWGGKVFRVDTKQNAVRTQFCLDYIEKSFADRPDLREAVTPTYPYPGKRPIFASTFYPALKEPNVELVPKAVASMTPAGIVDVDGVEREIDVLVMATGFQPADYLARLEVVGRRGRTLREYWAGEPHAFLGITAPEFPNFFILYGPGTNGGEIVTMLESQSEYAVRAMKRMRREGVTAIEVRPSFDRWWNRWLQSRMRGTSWTMSNNYFKAPTGKVVTQWPIGCVAYRALTKVLGRVSETTRRRTTS